MPLFPIYLIGSFPKPSYLKIPSWFDSTQFGFSAEKYSNYLKHDNNGQNQLLLDKAFNEVITEQINLGCDIVTDGELDRENYIWHFCRFCLNGFDFDNLKKITSRNGATCMYPPRIISKITLNSDGLDFMGIEWSKLQKDCCKAIKIAIPGPMTIMDSTYNEYYGDNIKELLFDLADCINKYLLNLTNKFNIKYIQIDEPIFARKPDLAKQIGFEAMKKCWNNIDKNIYKSIHLCCGYSDEVDVEHEKADNHSYIKLAKYGMDNYLFHECGVNAISIEDAHCRVPMKFYELINKLDIILGVIKVCQTTMYSTDDIVNRVNHIIKYGNINPNKLILAPDCGLAMLPINICRKKIKTLNKARNILRAKYESKL